MWKQLITPTLVVAGFWLVASLSTTVFIYWLDQSHQRVFTESLNSTQAASEIREHVWRLMSDFDAERGQWADDFHQSLPKTTQRVANAIGELRGIATTADGQQLVNRLEVQWQAYLDLLHPREIAGRDATAGARELRGAADAIALTSHEISQVNRQLMKSAEQSREHWKGIVYTVRFILLVIGPATGIALGWWVSQRLHRSISQINIILRGAGVELDENLAKLRLSGREDLADLRDHVERVVQRMSQVSAELDSARRETLRSERLAAVGALAAGVAHELRNPLTSVKLLLQNAAQQPGETKLSDEESCVMLDEVVRMENTIQGLLDFSRPPPLQRQRHDLRDTLQRGFNLVHGRAKQQCVQLETHLPGQPLFVDGDPEQLHQVCVNLLINGIEADAGGILEIQAEENLQDALIRVRFRDLGPGIPEDVLVHLFEPFVSTKQGGTGLGLAISRRIVAQHGGSLRAENSPDGGAIFTLELPAVGHREIQEPPANCDCTPAAANPSTL